MRILLCNDDSVHARGIKVLFAELSKKHDVIMVAPLEEKSTAGHSLTIHKPLRMVHLEKNVYGVSGSPADCVHVGISQLFKKKRPDFVVSGINRGANLGQDVFYSGTVSAAREASMFGLPSLAVSLAIDFAKFKREEKSNYPTAAYYSSFVIDKFFASKALLKKIPEHTVFNLNVPDLALKKVKGLTLASQGFRHYSDEIVKRSDHRGKDYYWVGGGYLGYRKIRGSDCERVDHGFAALTPLKLDTTHNEFLMEMVSRWGNTIIR